MSDISDRKFPIGPFVLQDQISDDEFQHFIDKLANIPAQYRKLVEHLSERDLARTYREGGWNIRQLVHHVADIHYLHCFRVKKALTEPVNTITTLIDMNEWACTTDSLIAPVSDSLQILEGINNRYLALARSLSPQQLDITYYHPARQIWFNQKQSLAVSAWHTRHHLAHIQLALEE